MNSEVVGYSPNDVVRAIKENAPPNTVVSDAEWSAWAGEAGKHERLHTLPSRNHTETMSTVWEYGVITSTLAIMMPDVINNTYLTMKWLYFEVATSAFVQPRGGFEQLPAQVIKESAEAVGRAAMSDPDWVTWEQARDQVIREEWQRSLEPPADKPAGRDDQQATSKPPTTEPEPNQPESDPEKVEVPPERKPDSQGVIYPQPESSERMSNPSFPLTA